MTEIIIVEDEATLAEYRSITVAFMAHHLVSCEIDLNDLDACKEFLVRFGHKISRVEELAAIAVQEAREQESAESQSLPAAPRRRAGRSRA